MTAALPKNEAERLRALARYAALDTHPDPGFDRITQLAGQIFDAPICLVSLIDETRQFFKSRVGLEISQTPRSQAFCAHGILQEEPLVVTDAMADPRFLDNPLVTGFPYIRFYVGAQLRTKDGFKLGTLCVIDTKPRACPSGKELGILQTLAAQVVELLEARQGDREIQILQCDVAGLRQTLNRNRARWSRIEQTATLALTAGGMGFWEWDESVGMTHWSELMFLLMGLPAEKATPPARQWIQRVHPEDRRPMAGKFGEARTSSGPFSLKFRVVHDNGDHRWVTITGDHFTDSEGVCKGAVGVAWDSTDEKAEERAIAESEELFRSLSASCPVGIFKSDLHGTATYCNPRLAEIWGFANVSEFQDAGWKSRIHPEDVEGVELAARQVVEKRVPVVHEYRLLFPDGSIRWVLSRTAIVNDAKGHAAGAVGTVDDITNRKQTLEDLHVAKAAAEMASRSKDAFLTNVSHELRTPLNGVLGISDLLLETELDDEQRQMAEIVRDSGLSLLKVVNDILDFSRIEACKLSLENRPFDWNEMLQQVISIVRPEADRKGIALIIQDAGNGLGKFVGDVERIKQVLLVYLTNALKFTAVGNVTIAVATQPISGEAFEVVVTVRDTGPGVPLRQQPKLFLPFSQADSSLTRKHGGAGLGLAIAKRLAEFMGGSVGLESIEGQGATFWLRLTLSSFVERRRANDEKMIRSLGEKSSFRILLVEDNTDNQQVALAMLWRLGYHADVADDGLMAMDMARAKDYGLIFMDCHMPRMDGYEGTQEIRKQEKEQGRRPVPVVAITARVMVGDRERCLQAGMDDYLSKPLGLEALRAVLERWNRAPVETTLETVLA